MELEGDCQFRRMGGRISTVRGSSSDYIPLIVVGFSCFILNVEFVVHVNFH